MSTTRGIAMKRISIASVVLAIGLTGIVQAADKHDHSPKHGGVVVEVKDVDYELVARPEVISLYLRDHGKGVDLKGASAKLTLLTGAEKIEVALVATTDRLEARGTFSIASGTKVVAIVTRPGKPVQTVRFTLK